MGNREKGKRNEEEERGTRNEEWGMRGGRDRILTILSQVW